jgi:hypothetical protein
MEYNPYELIYMSRIGRGNCPGGSFCAVPVLLSVSAEHGRKEELRQQRCV